MDPSTMSHADLVGELLTPRFGDKFNDTPCEVSSKASYGLADHGPASLLTRKLNIARELWLRHLRAQMRQAPVMSTPHVVRDWLRLYFAGLQNEVFVVLHLNSQNVLIDAVKLFSGSLMQTAVYPREVVKSAMAYNAAAVVLAHNHPSGQPEPSRADELLTQRLQQALEFVDVRVLDHLVVGGDQIISFAERGLL